MRLVKHLSSYTHAMVLITLKNQQEKEGTRTLSTHVLKRILVQLMHCGFFVFGLYVQYRMFSRKGFYTCRAYIRVCIHINYNRFVSVTR